LYWHITALLLKLSSNSLKTLRINIIRNDLQPVKWLAWTSMKLTCWLIKASGHCWTSRQECLWLVSLKMCQSAKESLFQVITSTFIKPQSLVLIRWNGNNILLWRRTNVRNVNTLFSTTRYTNLFLYLQLEMKYMYSDKCLKKWIKMDCWEGNWGLWCLWCCSEQG